MTSRAARADDAPTAASVDEARRLFREAVEREDAGDLARAVALYREALAHAVSPQLLFNIASCEERLDHLVEAAKTFREAEDVARSRGNEEVLREARARLDQVQKVAPRILVRPPAGIDLATLEIVLDGAPVAGSAAPVLVDPGEHRLAARASDGATFEIGFAVRRGDVRTVDIAFPTSTAGAAAPAPPVSGAAEPTLVAPPRPSAVPIVIAGGATLVLGSFAVATFVAGHAKKERYVVLNDAPTRENEAERIALADEGQSLYTASTVLTISAAVAGAATVYFLVRTLSSRGPARAAAPWVAPQVRGRGVELGGTF